MSLIQEALEKVGKTDVPAKPSRPVEKIKQAADSKKVSPGPIKQERMIPQAPFKVEAQKTPTAIQNKPAASPAAPALEAKKKNFSFEFSRMAAGVLIAALFLAGLALFQFFAFRSVQKSEPAAAPKPSKSIEAPTPQPVKAERVVPAPQPRPKPVVNPARSFYDSQPRFKLSGTTISGGEPLALVNNQVVGIGDILKENATVKDIQSRQVILSYNGQDVILTM